MIYIDAEENYNKIITGRFKNIKSAYQRITRKFYIRKLERGILIIIPENNIIKYQKNILKWLKINNIKEICLSKKLDNEEYFKNMLYGENINILDGRWLINYMVFDIIKIIANNIKYKIEKLEISIMTNENQEFIIENIIFLAKKVKVLNIITEEPNKFKNIEKFLYNEYGVIINITNNYKKSLLKSNIIINFNFVEEKINIYAFKNNAVLVNLQEKIELNMKKFNGININYFDIYIPNRYSKEMKELENFNKVILYESFIKRKDKFCNIRKIIENDKVKIKDLIGKNGIINKIDYEILSDTKNEM